jgi:hypothetical protein
VNGLWTGVIGLSALPGAVVGAAVGTGAVRIAASVVFRNSSPRWTSAIQPQVTFPSALALSIVAAAAVSYLLSLLTQRIPLVSAVRGAPLMSSKLWVRPMLFGLVFAGALGWRSRLLGWQGELAIFVAGFAISALVWALMRSKRLVAASGALVSIVGLVVLHRSWGRGGSGASLILVVTASFVVIGGLVGAYVATAPGQHFARFGVPRADALALSALRTRVATRPGPWPLFPVVSAVLAMSATATSTAILLTNATSGPVSVGQRDSLVLHEFVPETLTSVMSAVPSLASDQVISVRMNTASVSLPARDPAVPAPLHRRAGVMVSLPANDAQREMVIGVEAAKLYGETDRDGVVLVAEMLRKVFGFVTPVGSTVTVRSADGIEVPLVVRAIVDRAAGSPMLLMNQETLSALTKGEAIHSLALVVPGQGTSMDELQTQLNRALVGRSVFVSDTFNRQRATNAVERFGGRAHGLVILFNLLSAAVLVWRWASARRSLLQPTNTAAIGPGYLARSITQDATAHVGVAGFLGGVAGMGLGWALLPAVGSMTVPVMVLLMTVVLPAVLAAIVARFSGFPSGRTPAATTTGSE